MNTIARDHYLAEFARAAPNLPGTLLPWLSRLRSDALDRFAQAGIPTVRNEEWKYTSLAAFERKAFSIPPDGVASDINFTKWVTELVLEQPSGHMLVFHNGYYSAALSTPTALPDGVTIQSIAAVLEHAPDILEPYLCDTHRQTPFGLLNTAFLTDGAYLYLQHDTVVEQPIHLLFLSTQNHIATYLRNVIVAEPGSRATIIEHYAGVDGNEYFTNAVTQIFTADNATIDHYKVQKESLNAYHIAALHAMQGRRSHLASHSIALGAVLARNDITTTFDGTGCIATLNGLYLVDGRRHIDHHTRVDHEQPHGTSNEYYRGILDDAARAVFNGKVIVHPNAQQTNALQINHNLLLSRDAEVDTKPELEIYADDVKCSHGATVGQLNDEQLFYLRARGIDANVARNLLIQAFAQEVIQRIQVVPLRERLQQILLSRLPHGDKNEEPT
jgi:Fe-S cluster assembly protein SufD